MSHKGILNKVKKNKYTTSTIESLVNSSSKMHAAKKTLKLSRKHSEKLGKADAPLDDSLDDFIVTRPLRAER